MKTASILVLFVCLAGGAVAQLDPGPDGIGIYFDMDATIFCTTTAAPFTSITAYLLITDPSTSEPITGWEARCWITGAPVAPSWSLANGVDLDPDPLIYDVSFDPVQPTGSTFLLATWTGFIMAPTDLISFDITGVPGSVRFPDSPGYITDGLVPRLHPLHTMFYPASFVAMINGNCSLGN